MSVKSIVSELVPLSGEKGTKSSHADKKKDLVLRRVLFKISAEQPRPLYLGFPSRVFTYPFPPNTSGI